MTEKTKILVPLTSAELGGGQIFLLTLLDNLAADFSFTVWLFAEGALIDELEKRNIPYQIFSAKMQRTPWGLMGLLRALRQEKPEVIYLHASRLISLLAKPLRIPVVERMNMSRRWEVGGWCNRLPWLDSLMTRWNTHLIAVSEAIKSQLLSRGIAPRKISVIHNCVDLRRYHQADLRRSARRTLGIPEDAVVVLNIGRLVRQKGQADFLEVAARCLPKNKQLYFLIVGDGGLRKPLQRKAESLGLPASGRFQMLPFQPAIERVYAAGDLLLHTALWEPLGNVLLEAMAMGLTVIATDVDGTSEVIVPGQSGILVPKGDVSGMVTEILTLAADEKKSTALCEGAFAKVEAQHSVEAVMSKYATLFTRLKKGEA